MNDDSAERAVPRDTVQYVTVLIDNQVFGLPIARVHDVFVPEHMTRVPLAAREVAGVLNLRGRIVTAIDMRERLHLAPRDDAAVPMAVGIERKGESYGLIIDSVGEVLDLPRAEAEPNPTNLDRRWAEIAAGIHRLDGRLMIILDVDHVLGRALEAAAA